MFEFRELQALIAVNRTGSYTAAAEMLGYTQPAVSYQMRRLQQEVGARLIIQTSRGARLTQAGVRWTSSGENIGDGGPEPDTGAAIAQLAVTLTQDMLAEKPPDDGHRLNILSSSFRSIGICVYRDAGGIVWMTQDFSG